MKTVLLALIRGYQYALAPFLGGACRFSPSCSNYALESVSRFGALRGSVLATWRILRCNPFVPGGFDPPPDKFDLRSRPFKRGAHRSADPNSSGGDICSR